MQGSVATLGSEVLEALKPIHVAGGTLGRGEESMLEVPVCTYAQGHFRPLRPEARLWGGSVPQACPVQTPGFC